MNLPALDISTARAEITKLYDDPSAEMSAMRAAHFNAVMRISPYSMLANIGSACVVLWVFKDTVGYAIWAWWAVLVSMTGMALITMVRTGYRAPTHVTVRALRHATWNAGLLAAIWAVVPVFWFVPATPWQQLLLATLFAGLLAAGSFVLNPLPRACMLYAGIIVVASVQSLLRSGEPIYYGVAALLSFYGVTVVLGSISTWRKSTMLLTTIAQTERQEKMLALLLEDFEAHADEALWEIDTHGQMRYSSPRMAELLGLDMAEMRHISLDTLLRVLDAGGAADLQQALQVGRPIRGLRLALRTAKGVTHLSFTGKQTTDANGEVTGWRGVAADVTDKVRSEERLHQLAHTDSLTGLANRFTLSACMEQALRVDETAVLLMLDLDHFKAVNDTLGHAAGDELLKALAGRLRQCARPNDVVARLGGDEFAVLMAHPCDEMAARTMAQRLIAALVNPVALGERHVRVGGSIGIATWVAPGVGMDELFIQADTALYAAKEAGRGQFAVYDHTMGERVQRRNAVEAGLQHALEHGELELHWQPKLEIASGTVVGAEALMRWNSPVLGRVNPSEFIAVAEQSGLIDALGTLALQTACQVGAHSLAPLSIAVNVSPMQFRSGQLVGTVKSALQSSGLPADRLELEITESVFIEDTSAALQQLHALRALGVRIALDDFGTGYSSLAYLRRFAFDTIKIDRSFVQESLTRKDARAIISMIIQLATTLSIRTVAEGVETVEQLQAITSAGCDEMQGFLVAAALPLPEFEAFCLANAGMVNMLADTAY